MCILMLCLSAQTDSDVVGLGAGVQVDSGMDKFKLSVNTTLGLTLLASSSQLALSGRSQISLA